MINIKQLNEEITRLLKEEYNAKEYQKIMIRILRPVKSRIGLHFYESDNIQYAHLVDKRNNSIPGIYLRVSLIEPLIRFSCYYGKDDELFDEPFDRYLNLDSFGFKTTDGQEYTLPIDENNFEQQVKDLIPFVQAVLEVVETKIREKRDFYVSYLHDINDYKLGYYTVSINGKKYTTNGYKDWQQSAELSRMLGDKVKVGFCPTFDEKVTNLYQIDLPNKGSFIFKTEQEAEKAGNLYYNLMVKRRQNAIIPEIKIIPVYLDKTTTNKYFTERIGEKLYIRYPEASVNAYYVSTIQDLLYNSFSFGTMKDARIFTFKEFKTWAQQWL